jgi:hypothetical protein
VLPAFHLPLANIAFNITTKLPKGRKALLHHVFPILTTAPPPGSPPQPIVDVFSIMKCEGWQLGIDIAVSSDKTFTHGRSGVAAAAAAAAGVSGSGVAPSSAAGVLFGGPAGAAGSCWHYYQPYNLPHAFIGEFQIKYIIDMVDGFVNASPIVRYCRKLKPHYVRDRSPEAAEAANAVAAVRASIIQMPLLKQRIEINLTADVFRVHHDAQDADDPSDMAYIALSRCGVPGAVGCCSALLGCRLTKTSSTHKVKQPALLIEGFRFKPHAVCVWTAERRCADCCCHVHARHA